MQGTGMPNRVEVLRVSGGAGGKAGAAGEVSESSTGGNAAVGGSGGLGSRLRRLGFVTAASFCPEDEFVGFLFPAPHSGSSLLAVGQRHVYCLRYTGSSGGEAGEAGGAAGPAAELVLAVSPVSLAPRQETPVYDLGGEGTADGDESEDSSESGGSTDSGGPGGSGGAEKSGEPARDAAVASPVADVAAEAPAGSAPSTEEALQATPHGHGPASAGSSSSLSLAKALPSCSWMVSAATLTETSLIVAASPASSPAPRTPATPSANDEAGATGDLALILAFALQNSSSAAGACEVISPEPFFSALVRGAPTITSLAVSERRLGEKGKAASGGMRVVCMTRWGECFSLWPRFFPGPRSGAPGPAGLETAPDAFPRGPVRLQVPRPSGLSDAALRSVLHFDLGEAGGFACLWSTRRRSALLLADEDFQPLQVLPVSRSVGAVRARLSADGWHVSLALEDGSLAVLRLRLTAQGPRASLVHRSSTSFDAFVTDTHVSADVAPAEALAGRAPGPSRLSRAFAASCAVVSPEGLEASLLLRKRARVCGSEGFCDLQGCLGVALIGGLVGMLLVGISVVRARNSGF